MKKILLVLTGGTICTTVNQNGVRAIHSQAATVLQQGFMESDSVFRNEVTFDVSKNFGMLSENLSLARWNEWLQYFRSISFGKGYDGIIIAHGTDTLAYSAAMCSLLFAGLNLPVFLVSSGLPLSYEGANGHINFRTAVECICKDLPPQVYVPYRNQNGKLYLHLAARLQQCQNYSDDFYSRGAFDITKGISAKTKKALKELPGIQTLNPMGDWQFQNGVLALQPYPGLDYSALNLQGVKAIVHGTYHSGTACVQGKEYNSCSILYLMDRCEQSKIPLYLSPTKAGGEVYETVPTMVNHSPNGVTLLHGCTFEMVYVKVVLALALGMNQTQTKAFLTQNSVGEFFIQGEES